MFRWRRGIVRSDSWYINVNGGYNFQMISFDIKNSLFKCWLWFKSSASELLLIQSRSKFSSKDVISDGFVVAEAILFRWLSLISLVVFSNVGSGSIFFCFKAVVHTKLIKVLVKWCSALVISNCDGSLTGILLITSLSSDRNGVFDLIVTSYSSIWSYYLCCCSM